jgi:predicted PurR-regulated permease PerM
MSDPPLSSPQSASEINTSGEYWRNRIFFWLVFLALIILTILMIKPYFTALVLSLIAVIMLTPLYNYFLRQKRIRGREKVAVSLTLLSFVGILVVPVFLVALLIVNQLAAALSAFASIDLDTALQNVTQALDALPVVGNIQLEAVNVADGLQSLARIAGSAVADLAISLGASLPALLIQGMLFVVVVAALLPHYKVLVETLQRLSPLGYDISELYGRKITAMVTSLIKGVFLIAIAQGAAMGIFFWLAGLPYVLMFTILSMALAMIPLVGISWLVIAIAILSFLTGNQLQAFIVLGGFYGVVNWIDVLLRPKLLSREAYIPLALFLLSIFGGLAWAGVMGLFYGPVIMLLLVTTIQIYAEQYAQEDGALLATAIRSRRDLWEAEGEGENVQR